MSENGSFRIYSAMANSLFVPKLSDSNKKLVAIARSVRAGISPISPKLILFAKSRKNEHRTSNIERSTSNNVFCQSYKKIEQAYFAKLPMIVMSTTKFRNSAVRLP